MLNSLHVSTVNTFAGGIVSTEIDQVDERLTQLLENSNSADDDISSKELEESEAAFQHYLTGHDLGVSLKEVKLKLLKNSGKV